MLLPNVTSFRELFPSNAQIKVILLKRSAASMPKRGGSQLKSDVSGPATPQVIKRIFPSPGAHNPTTA